MKMNVLFVDDEPNVLSGLRRMLRCQSKSWNMHFASSGPDALSLLDRETIDVIVSDMRMPGMDGAELLDRVSKLHPHTVRLVLSGQSDHERILRVVGPAHQFLSKPCDPEVLIGTIERACGLQSHLQDVSLKDVISQIGHLPSLPAIYRELVGELESTDASIDRIGEVINADLAMSVKVLQLVNSSFFGIPQHVTCPKHAVSLLGLSVIRSLALTAGVFSQYEESDVQEFSLSESIDHGLAVATLARQIAITQHADEHTVDDTFIAGMLHDIGKLVLAAHQPERFAAATELQRSETIPLWTAELELFGTTHAEIGGHLLGLWGLPNPIVEAVAFHHRPQLQLECGLPRRPVASQIPTENRAKRTCNPLTAVHAANAIRNAQLNERHDADQADWDRDYLASVELGDQMSAWFGLVQEEAHS